MVRQFHQPTNNTSCSASRKHLTTFSVRLSFGEPGGPEISKMDPGLTPPSIRVSRDLHRVEYRLDCTDINAAPDCVNGGARRFWTAAMMASACAISNFNSIIVSQSRVILMAGMNFIALTFSQVFCSFACKVVDGIISILSKNPSVWC